MAVSLSALTLSLVSRANLLPDAVAPLHVYRAQAQATGLVGAWSFDEGSGTTAADSSGNGNTGTLMNGPTWTAGKIGSGALSFNGLSTGTGNRVDAGSRTILDDLGPLSISVWVNPAAQNSRNAIIAKDNGDNTGRWLLQTANANPYALSFSKTFSGSPSVGRRSINNVLIPNTWQHVAVTWDGSRLGSGIHIYVNGQEVNYAATTDANEGVTASDANFNLVIGGVRSGYYSFNGSLDEVRLYNRVLSNAEIQTLVSEGGISPPSDTTAPTLSAGSPSGQLPAGTTQTTLSLTTDENATCKYSTAAGTAYASMPNTFSTTGATSHSTTVSGLTNGSSYTYYIRCQDTAGNANTTDYTISFSVPSSQSSDTTAPSIPQNLQAAPVSSSQINLSWTASTDNVGVTGYRIYRSGTQVATTPSPSYSDTGLSASTSYTYTVSSYDAVGNVSAQSASVSAMTQASVPPSSGTDNTWIELSPTPAMHWEPASFTDCTRQALLSNPPSRSFSGSNIGEGRIYYFGGAHHSYPGNDMVVYDIAANQWLPDPQEPQCAHPVCPDPSLGPGPQTYDNYPSLCTPSFIGYEQYNPACLSGSCYFSSAPSKPAFRCAGGSRDGKLCAVDADCSAGSVFFPGTTGSGTCTVGIPTPGTVCTDCRPYAYHTYQQTVFNPIRRKSTMVIFSGTWEYDFATRSFSWLSRPPPRSGDLSNKLALWDPIRQRLIYVQTGGTFLGVYTFDYNTNTWSLLDTYLPSGTKNVQPYGTWDGSIGKFVISLGTNNPRWFVYDSSLTGVLAWTEITSTAPADVTGPGCAGTILPCHTSSMTYDAINRRTIVLTQDVGRVLTLWAYDATNNNWQKVTTNNGAVGAGRNTGTESNLHYDGNSASLYLIDSDSIWAYRPGGRVRTLKIKVNLGNLPPPDATPPSVPTGLTTTPNSSSQITLTWISSTDNVGVVGYKVYRDGVFVNSTTSTSYIDTGLVSNTTYTYTVAAFDVVPNFSAQSSPASATTLSLDTMPPTQPQNLRVTATKTTQVDLAWDVSADNVGVVGYKIYQNGSLVRITSNTSYSLIGLYPNTSYTFAVSAFDAQDNLSLQATVTATTPNGRLIQVGPTRTYKRPSDAAAIVQEGDIIEIDAGTYIGLDAVTMWPALFSIPASRANNLIIRGVGGMARLDAAGQAANSKGIWVLRGNNITVENIEFACATSRQNNPDCNNLWLGDYNDAGIRLDGSGLVVRNSIFRDNDNGILGGGNVKGVGDIIIENSEFNRNGYGDGFSHNLYIGEAHSLVFRSNYSHHANIGHLLKSRADENYVINNRIMDEQTGSSSNEIELPCGGLAYVIGNLLQKGPNADANQLVKFAAELSSIACPQPPNPTQKLYVINNTMVSDYGASATFINGAGSAPLLWAKNNIFRGAGTPINWPGTIVQSNNLLPSQNPLFANQTNYDYHLSSGSPAINGGVNPGVANGFSLVPTEQYVYPRSSEARPTQGAIDIGAYEYIGAISSSAFDFSLSAPSTISLSQGGSATTTVTATLTSGTPASLTFSASGLPSGVTASFSPTSCNPNCSSVLTLTASGGASLGSTPITITATSPAVTKTTTITLTVVDTTTPAISNITTSNLTSSAVTISLTTNEAATARLEYGVTNQLGQTISWTTTPATSHELNLSGLTSATPYFYRLRVRDSASNESVSTISTFTTLPPLDTTPPSSVTDLALASASATSLNLSWTASGDDGPTGQAASYDLRLSTSALTDANFTSAIKLTGLPAPSLSGSKETYTVISLNPATVYYLALKATDDAGLTSTISNILQAQTTSQPPPSGGGGGGGGGSVPDTTPPAPVSGLNVAVASGEARLTWTNPTDPDFVRTTIVRKPGTTPPSSYTDGTLIYEGTATSFTDTNLTNNQAYSYALFTLDRAGNRSSALSPSSGSVTPLPGVNTFTTSESATLTGLVTADRLSGSPLSGITITLTTPTSTLTTTTDSQGKYQFQNLTPGTYTLTVAKANRRSYTTPSFILSAGADETKDFYLISLAPPADIDLALSKRLAGRILLQVESKGEAWYVNPQTLKRHYLGRPADAFRIMREQGLGITDTNLQRIPEVSRQGTTPKNLNHVAGRILLQVESHGEAWYVNPQTLKRHYLGRPADAFRIMREQGLGISDKDLAKIAVE